MQWSIPVAHASPLPCLLANNLVTPSVVDLASRRTCAGGVTKRDVVTPRRQNIFILRFARHGNGATGDNADYRLPDLILIRIVFLSDLKTYYQIHDITTMSVNICSRARTVPPPRNELADWLYAVVILADKSAKNRGRCASRFYNIVRGAVTAHVMSGVTIVGEKEKEHYYNTYCTHNDGDTTNNDRPRAIGTKR